MRLSFVLLLLFIAAGAASGQDSISIKNIRVQYESFEYNKVIQLSDQLLQKRDSLKKEDVLDILLMKAVSHYVLSEEDKVRKCFIDILKTDRSYLIDSEKISPKIVKIFNEVKDDYNESVPQQQKKEEVVKQKPVMPNYAEIFTRYKEEKESVVRSFIFPGWGHIYSGKILKGAVISSAAAINAGALIYFIIDSNNKRRDYLSETNESLISSKYSSYNNSYKARNYLIGSLALLYIYTQLDILVLNPATLPELNFDLNNTGNSISFNLKYSF